MKFNEYCIQYCIFYLLTRLYLYDAMRVLVLKKDSYLKTFKLAPVDHMFFPCRSSSFPNVQLDNIFRFKSLRGFWLWK